MSARRCGLATASLSLAASAGVLLCPAIASAAIIFNEQFNTNSSSADMSTNYSAYNVTGGTASVVGQELNLSGTSTLVTSATFGGHRLISVDLNAASGVNVGNSQIGMTLGTGGNANTVIFHPGFSGGGALRVEGTGGFGNQDVGFIPAVGVTHKMTIENSGTGDFIVTLVNGSNPFQSFSKTWTNSSLSISSFAIGLFYNQGTGEFDNWTVDDFTAVPEPASLGVLVVAGAGAGMMRRRTRKHA